jgi:hypothetical protein
VIKGKNRKVEMAMDEVREKKQEIRNEISTFFSSLSKATLEANTRIIENRLFEFANFLESKIVLLYVNAENEVATDSIVKRAFEFNKIVVLPAFNPAKSTMRLMKVDHPAKDWWSARAGFSNPTRPNARLFRWIASISPSFPASPWMRRAGGSVPETDTTTGSSRIFP